MTRALSIAAPFAPRAPGNAGIGADAKKIADACQKHINREHQGQGRHLGRITGVAHKKCVRQVVDHGYDLAEDGWYRQSCNGSGDRFLFKYFCFINNFLQ